MIYQIDVNLTKNKQFLQMVELMTDLGVIKSISLENVVSSHDTSLSDEELLEVIEASEKDFENGNTYTMEEVRQMAESWENRSKNSPALPNHTLTDDELLDVIFESKEQIKNDNFYTTEEVKQRIDSSLK